MEENKDFSGVDGIDHININYYAKTRLGRTLDNTANSLFKIGDMYFSTVKSWYLYKYFKNIERYKEELSDKKSKLIDELNALHQAYRDADIDGDEEKKEECAPKIEELKQVTDLMHKELLSLNSPSNFEIDFIRHNVGEHIDMRLNALGFGNIDERFVPTKTQIKAVVKIKLDKFPFFKEALIKNELPLKRYTTKTTISSKGVREEVERLPLKDIVDMVELLNEIKQEYAVIKR